tara:strand:+ start:317 stop:523 length:207 start_codon:yes stop_codon:yes gene_type:complete
MCLGGGGPLPQAKFLSRVDPPPGPPSPQDMVNGMEIKPTLHKPPGDDSRTKTTTKKTPNQSTKNPGMY